MKTFNFKKIDAFTSLNSEGNPAGYIHLNSLNEISEEDMLRIAYELKGFVNEVGYMAKEDKDTYKLRYFSSEREVEFCGHATIAIMYDLIKNNKALEHTDSINIITNKGRLIVENKVKENDAVFIMAPEPKFKSSKISIGKIAEALKIETMDIDQGYEVEIVNGGLETLIVPIKSLEVILNLKPKLEELKQFCVSNNLDTIEVFCNKTVNSDHPYRTRVFAPTFGYLEDPATGSGNSAFGYYLLKHKLWNGDMLSLEQNGLKERYNVVKIKAQQDINQNIRVMFGGGATVRIEGNYLLS